MKRGRLLMLVIALSATVFTMTQISYASCVESTLRPGDPDRAAVEGAVADAAATTEKGPGETASPTDETPGKPGKLASGQTLELASRPNALDAVAIENVIPTTAELLLNSQAERDFILGRISEGYTICVATRDMTQRYIDSIISAFLDPDSVRSLVEQESIIFSMITNATLFGVIESLAEKDLAQRTLNILTPQQIEALKSGV